MTQKKSRKQANPKEYMSDAEAARKPLHLATLDITRKRTMPIRNWPPSLSELFQRAWPL